MLMHLVKALKICVLFISLNNVIHKECWVI